MTGVGKGGNATSVEPPKGCHWIGPWRQLDDPIWKWTRYYENDNGVIGCIERVDPLPLPQGRYDQDQINDMEAGR